MHVCNTHGVIHVAGFDYCHPTLWCVARHYLLILLNTSRGHCRIADVNLNGCPWRSTVKMVVVDQSLSSNRCSWEVCIPDWIRAPLVKLSFSLLFPVNVHIGGHETTNLVIKIWTHRRINIGLSPVNYSYKMLLFTCSWSRDNNGLTQVHCLLSGYVGSENVIWKFSVQGFHWVLE